MKSAPGVDGDAKRGDSSMMLDGVDFTLSIIMLGVIDVFQAIFEAALENDLGSASHHQIDGAADETARVTR